MLTSNVGHTLLVFFLTPRVKLIACVTSAFTSVVQWVCFNRKPHDRKSDALAIRLPPLASITSIF